jgi:hypothetical protein
MKNLFFGLIMLVGSMAFANSSTKNDEVKNLETKTSVETIVKAKETKISESNIDSKKAIGLEDSDVIIIVICDDTGCLVVVFF